MRTFRSISPERVHTGSGCIARLGRSLDDVAAKRVLVMTTASLSQFVNEIETLVGARHMGTFGGCSQHSPAASVGAAAIMAEGADAIISFGGGSVIDTAKAVAGRVGYPAQIAIPTTLSAGEFTPGAGITEVIDHPNSDLGIFIHIDGETTVSFLIKEIAALLIDPILIEEGDADISVRHLNSVVTFRTGDTLSGVDTALAFRSGFRFGTCHGDHCQE